MSTLGSADPPVARFAQQADSGGRVPARTISGHTLLSVHWGTGSAQFHCLLRLIPPKPQTVLKKFCKIPCRFVLAKIRVSSGAVPRCLYFFHCCLRAIVATPAMCQRRVERGLGLSFPLWVELGAALADSAPSSSSEGRVGSPTSAAPFRTRQTPSYPEMRNIPLVLT
jgi:hypothetical protein